MYKTEFELVFQKQLIIVCEQGKCFAFIPIYDI